VCVIFDVQDETEETTDHLAYNTEYILCNIWAEAEETIEHDTKYIQVDIEDITEF
jgi:hypothetical protein